MIHQRVPRFLSIGRSMNRWCEAALENIDQRLRGQHRDVTGSMACSVLVAFETPEKLSPLPDKHNIVTVPKNCAVRQAFYRSVKSHLLPFAVNASGVKRLVDRERQRSACLGLAMRPAPHIRKLPVSLSPTFCTGAMSCRKCRRFIQKEQLSIFSRGHDRPLSVFEAESTCHPILKFVWADDCLAVVMQDSTVPPVSYTHL